MKDVEFEASYTGAPGDETDLKAERIIKTYGGEITGSGTFLPTSARDLQVKVPAVYARACKEALQKAGLTITQ